MDQELTEEQQRSAHKIIKANRGDCGKRSNFLSCVDCPNSSYNSGVLCFTSDFPERSKSPAFQAENLRRSQTWLDQHITDAEIMSESPREFCERMVRTKGFGKCFASITENNSLCKNCAISIDGDDCCPNECLERAKTYLSSHPATPQEPPKRRPKPDEMVVGAPVRVRLWDELVKDGILNCYGDIVFKNSVLCFTKEMRKFCGTTHKIIMRAGYPYLEGCGYLNFTSEMLDYVDPEKVVEPEPVANAPTPEAKEKGDTTVKGDVDKLPIGLRFINFRDLLPVDALRIITLEGQVDDLTKKLAASTRKCDRLQRRLRANWEAKHTTEEIEAWFDAGNGSASLAGEKSKICPNGHTTWIPATRGNLKL